MSSIRSRRKKYAHDESIDESPVSAAAIGYVELSAIGALQHGVIARDRVLVEHDITLFAAADSKDPIARHRELAHLSVDLDFKISSGNVTHGM